MRFVVVCLGAEVTVGNACLWWSSVETANRVQLETVIGTLLIGSRGVDVSLKV